MSVDLEHFIDLPEPPIRGDDTISGRIDDDYLLGIENYIKAIHDHLQKIQEQENILRNEFAKKLSELHAQPQDDTDKGKGGKKNEEREIFEKFDSKMKKLKKRRKGFRQMLYDGYNERKKLIESMSIQKREEEYLRRKLQKLAAVDKLPSEAIPMPDFFAIIMVPAQIVTLIIYWIACDYDDDEDSYSNRGPPNRVDNLYEYYTNIAMFTLLGFAFLYTFLRKYAYSAIGYSFFLVAWAFELTILWRVLWNNVYHNHDDTWHKGELTIAYLIEGMYGAATMMIIFGAIVGRCGPVKLILITFLAVFFYTLNNYICILVFKAMDLGGTITIHLFGAYFGLALGFAMYLPVFGQDPAARVAERDRQAAYISNVFSILGTLIIFVMFPAFVVAFAPDGSQFRVIINTVLAITSSAIVAFIGSRTFRGGKFLMYDIQRATLAGGVAIGSATAVVVSPGGAMVVGGIVGTAAILSAVYIQPVLEGKFRVVDVSGVNNVHGIPGILGGIAGIISAAIVCTDGNSQYGQPLDQLYHRGQDQAGYQAAALATSFGIAIGGGLLTGLIMWLFGVALWKVLDMPVFEKSKRWWVKLEGLSLPYTDETNWRVPTDFERTKLSVAESQTV